MTENGMNGLGSKEAARAACHSLHLSVISPIKGRVEYS